MNSKINKSRQTDTTIINDLSRPKKVHAFSDDALGDHDATGIAKLIESGKVSAREVNCAAINRAKLINPYINAVQIDCYDKALQQANSAKSGFFSGVPFFLKDNTDIKGIASNHGSLAVKALPAKKNSVVTDQLLAQGFVVLGKSTLPELGLSASTEFMSLPPTRNPWHTDYSSGASSGGSAALVAAGIVPIAHANDGGGSIRIPAACCGLIGLKSSRGRFIDSDLARTLPINIVSEGVLTRSVRDTAHFFAGMEKTFQNKKLAPIGLVEGASKRSLRIGLVFDSITGNTDVETRVSVLATAKLLESMGHHILETRFPIHPVFSSDFKLYWGFLAFMASTFGKKGLSPNFDANKLDHFSVGLSLFYKKNFYKTPLVFNRLKKISDAYAKFFNQFDVILSPVLGHTTPELGYLSPNQPFEQLFERLQNYANFTPLHNIAGAPAISLPVGHTHHGLPIGVQFSAKHGEERTLLEIAFAIEEAMPWRRIQDEQR